NAIDSFIAKKLHEAKLQPNPKANNAKLLRRLSLVLRGIPPTLNEVDQFIADKSSNAYEKMVDTFLRDSSTAERLTLEWLDIARYGDSAGLFEDSYRSMWPWRDWVVNSFHKNIPFDQFITEQVAGDLLPSSTLEQKVATGFFRNNPTSNEGGIIDEEYLLLYAADRVKTTGIAFLGMSMECCQCHDHKYDPLLQSEFYQMSAFFRSIDEKGRQYSTAAPTIDIPSSEQKTQKAKLEKSIKSNKQLLTKLEKSPSGWQSQFEEVQDITFSLKGNNKTLVINEVSFIGLKEKPQIASSKKIKDLENIIDGKNDTTVEFRDKNPTITLSFAKPVTFQSLAISFPEKLKKRNQGLQIIFKNKDGKTISLEQNIKATPLVTIKARTPQSLNLVKQLKTDKDKLTKLQNEIPKSMIMKELKTPRKTYILDRGDYEKRLGEVNPGVPRAILSFEGYEKNRLGLAKWLTHKQNPLTARVIINRYWQLVFGQGIVSTAEDFGLQGELPSHPELLDWLAVEFVESKWNLKHVLKLMVMSATFQQSSHFTSEKFKKDPNNIFLSRGQRMRLGAEQIRDNALAISELLVNQIGGPPVKPYQPPGLWKEKTTKMPFVQDHGDKLYRKTLYTFWRRTAPHPSSVTFDATDRTTCIARRRQTNTPLQALVLLNDVQYVEAARVFAANSLKSQGSIKDKIKRAFRKATSRVPKEQEVDILLKEYTSRLKFYKANLNAAEDILSAGESPLDKTIPTDQHAAFMAVSQLILNLDETITLD
ncbi:MAG: DUF1553 domain-containing protein, partial [Lentisphaeraceae bacterium]|nr:DUF1553 domain-containing protein [Lentisphaeraceae bacterium]